MYASMLILNIYRVKNTNIMEVYQLYITSRWHTYHSFQFKKQVQKKYIKTRDGIKVTYRNFWQYWQHSCMESEGCNLTTFLKAII